MTLVVGVVAVVGSGGCITPEDDGGGADTDGAGKASASAMPTSASGDDSTGGSEPSASDDESETNVPSTSGTTGDTESTSSFTTTLDDTGSSDDSAGVTTASDSSGSSTGAGVVTFAANIQPIINANCGCHQGGGTAGQLVMDAGVAYDNLVGVQSTQAAGVVRVEPMDPAASYMFHKLSGTQADVGGSGNQMPPGGPLNADQVMLVEQWIVDGAMP